LIASINPITVDVYRGTEGIDIRLEALAAYFAIKTSDAGFSIDLAADAVFVVAEETGEC
jgi:hypothetical protein